MKVLHVIRKHCIIKKTGMGIKEREDVGTPPVLQEGTWSRLGPCRPQLHVQPSLDQRFYSDTEVSHLLTFIPLYDSSI